MSEKILLWRRSSVCLGMGFLAGVALVVPVQQLFVVVNLERTERGLPRRRC